MNHQVLRTVWLKKKEALNAFGVESIKLKQILLGGKSFN